MFNLLTNFFSPAGSHAIQHTRFGIRTEDYDPQ
jgi:hypothetical protein